MKQQLAKYLIKIIEDEVELNLYINIKCSENFKH